MPYVFDPKDLREIAKKGIALPRPQIFEAITEELSKQYPGFITREPEWFFNNAGGAMGTMTFLYASLREYLIFFGSPIGNQGHSGRYHFVDDWFWVLEGELWNFAEGDTERQVFKPGDETHLPRGTAQAYRILDNAWGLEYARGWIPTMIPFGLADTAFSTLDYRTAFKNFRIYGQHVFGNWIGRMSGKALQAKGKIP